MMPWNEFVRWIGEVFQPRHPYHDADWYEVTSDGDNLRHLLAVPVGERNPHRYQCDTLWEIYQERHWSALLDDPRLTGQARMMMWSRRVNVMGKN